MKITRLISHPRKSTQVSNFALSRLKHGFKSRRGYQSLQDVTAASVVSFSGNSNGLFIESKFPKYLFSLSIYS